jgi:DnaJ-class molecular chaperone
MAKWLDLLKYMLGLMMSKDYYSILGVDKDSSMDEIKRKYRALAKKYHPDNSKGEPGSEERFKEIALAYEVLSNPKKREEYDQRGEEVFYSNNLNDFDSFFSSFFKGAAPSKKEYSLSILLSFKESIFGAERSFLISNDKKRERVDIAIPKGVSDGSLLRFSKKVFGAQAEIYVSVAVEPHPLYKVNGLDLYLTLPITPTEAVLGATIEVSSFYSTPIKIKIPARVSSGHILRIKNNGVRKDSRAGDMYLTLAIVSPTHISDKTLKLFRKAHDEMNFNPRDLIKDDLAI